MNETQACFVLFAVVSAVWDVRTRRLPNGLVVAGGAAALALHGIGQSGEGLLFSLSGAVGGLILALPLYVLKAVNGGDVKWFGAAGAFVGANSAALLLAGSVIVSGVAALILSTLSSRVRKSLTNIYWFLWIGAATRKRAPLPKPETTFPFMLSVIPAMIGVFLWLE